MTPREFDNVDEFLEWLEDFEPFQNDDKAPLSGCSDS